MADDDAELVALIDNELDESRRTALLARLAADERLRQRYEEFRQTGAPLAASLDELLTQAPLARLRAALPADEPPRRPSGRFAGIALRDLAAGIIGILAGGAAAWVALSLGLLGERQDWRTAVVEYTNMYSKETFAPLKPDAQLQAIELSALGARLGANLTPENVALPGL
jgi:anti-sigma factor RsiW